MRSDRLEIDLLPVMTLVLWLTCLVVGLVGHFVLVSSPAEPGVQKPTEATLVNVSLADSSAAPLVGALAVPSISEAPPSPQAAVISTPVEFSIPKQLPTPIVVVAQKPVFEQITFGSGEGNQPKPDYPIEAELDGQEGTVEVQFVVGKDGRVASTDVTRPCSWPLLNQSAERSIRESWTYPAGPIRYFKVSITYRQKH